MLYMYVILILVGTTYYITFLFFSADDKIRIKLVVQYPPFFGAKKTQLTLVNITVVL